MHFLSTWAGCAARNQARGICSSHLCVSRCVRNLGLSRRVRFVLQATKLCLCAPKVPGQRSSGVCTSQSKNIIHGILRNHATATHHRTERSSCCRRGCLRRRLGAIPHSWSGGSGQRSSTRPLCCAAEEWQDRVPDPTTRD